MANLALETSDDGASSLRTQPSRYSSVSLLSFAGYLVLASAFTAALLWATIAGSGTTGHELPVWGFKIFAPLSMMLIAMVVGSIPIFRSCEGCDAGTVLRPTSMTWVVFLTLIGVHVSFAQLYFGRFPDPAIDTFTFQRDACGTLMRGGNPYGSTQANIFDPYHTRLFYGRGMVVNGRVQVGFQYPPLTLYWATIGYLLGGVRYSYILAVVVTAFFWLLLCPTERGLLLTAVLLLSPVTFVVEYLCWTEPLVLMMLSVSVYAMVKGKWWMPISFGLFLATKQYNFLALPLMGLLIRPFGWRAYWKVVGISIGICALTILPFAIWNFSGLWRDVVLFHFAQPFRADALSFAVPFPVILKLGPFLIVAFMILALRVARPSPSNFGATYAVSLLLFFLTSKQAFTNYYFLIANSFFLAATALPQWATKSEQVKRI